MNIPVSPAPRNPSPSRSSSRLLAISLTVLVVVSLFPVSAMAAGTWLDEDFTDGVEGVFDEGWGVAPTSAGHVGPGLISRIPAGEHWGSSAHWNTKNHLGSEPTEMWIRYYLRFAPGFEVADGNRGKLPGYGGLYTYNCLGGRPSTAGAPCWSARMMFSPLYVNDGLPSDPYDADAVTRIGFYTYSLNPDGSGRTGDVRPWDADTATLAHGRWYCVETRLALNTPGQPDGVLEGYVDGKRAFGATNLMFRRASESSLKIKSLWFDIYHGGAAASPADNSIFFDSLAAGPERIGCDDSGGFQGTFADDDSSVFEADIEALAASEVTKGCNPPLNDRFCPTDPVTRGQMAAFLHRALGDTLDVSTAPVPDSPPDFWGMRSATDYTKVLDGFAPTAAPLDSFVVTYPIDDPAASNDWLASGPGTPEHWVPIQLGNIATRGAIPYVQVTVDDLGALASGSLDARLDGMLDAFGEYLAIDPDSKLFLDILPEANRNQRSYGDDPSRFVSAFRRVAERARARLGTSRVRVVYSGNVQMSSDRYSVTDHPHGAPDLFFPGRTWVDVAGVRARLDSASTSPSSAFGSALSALATEAGSDMPLLIGPAAAPDSPSANAQIGFLADLAGFAADHPQVAGVIWDDVDAGSNDFRISDDPVAVAAAASGLDADAWLFSSEVDRWRESRGSAGSFSDTTGSVFQADIAWLAGSGITRGCNPPTNSRFCPTDHVTRGQMAAFLTRALGLNQAKTTFADTQGHVFAGDIAALAAAGITRGCNPPTNTRFCPDERVTRGQMAAFLMRAGLTD
ncbi:MAG TPA: S-layer homology domain-containing protein [Acidimicrobiia bacterium]|nr:S-layer homology domain-containing protein [Acidimicrobiia bacterium]